MFLRNLTFSGNGLNKGKTCIESTGLSFFFFFFLRGKWPFDSISTSCESADQ